MSFSINGTELNIGVCLCYDKSKRLLKAAEMLTSDEENLVLGYGLYIFAIEEYGKGLLLRQLKPDTTGMYAVDRWLFGYGDKRSHEKKIKKALENLPSNQINIRIKVMTALDEIETTELKSGKKVFSRPASTTGTFSTTTGPEVEEDIRWRCFFVDWDDKNGHWKYEFVPNKGELLTAISNVRRHIVSEINQMK